MKRAPLTAGLLVAKGSASPSGDASAPESGTVEFLPKENRARAAAAGEAGLTRVSLRMPTARHLRLRLAAAHLGRSNHALMLAAIDHYIDTVLPLLVSGRCACVEQGRAPAGDCAALGFGRAHPEHRS